MKNEGWCIPKDWNGVFSQHGEFFPEHINCRSVVSRVIVVYTFFDWWHRWVLEERTSFCWQVLGRLTVWIYSNGWIERSVIMRYRRAVVPRYLYSIFWMRLG